jgi:hypothetical protein
MHTRIVCSLHRSHSIGAHLASPIADLAHWRYLSVMQGERAGAVGVGDIYCVAAHPYLRWTVIAVKAAADALTHVVLRSSADPAVERVVALPVLQNPARFRRMPLAS